MFICVRLTKIVTAQNQIVTNQYNMFWTILYSIAHSYSAAEYLTQSYHLKRPQIKNDKSPRNVNLKQM